MWVVYAMFWRPWRVVVMFMEALDPMQIRQTIKRKKGVVMSIRPANEMKYYIIKLRCYQRGDDKWYLVKADSKQTATERVSWAGNVTSNELHAPHIPLPPGTETIR